VGRPGGSEPESSVPADEMRASSSRAVHDTHDTSAQLRVQARACNSSTGTRFCHCTGDTRYRFVPGPVIADERAALELCFPLDGAIMTTSTQKEKA
jgi:hypothetical protein